MCSPVERLSLKFNASKNMYIFDNRGPRKSFELYGAKLAKRNTGDLGEAKIDERKEKFKSLCDITENLGAQVLSTSNKPEDAVESTLIQRNTSNK